VRVLKVAFAFAMGEIPYYKEGKDDDTHLSGIRARSF
jgi:hypothetical protein